MLSFERLEVLASSNEMLLSLLPGLVTLFKMDLDRADQPSLAQINRHNCALFGPCSRILVHHCLSSPLSWARAYAMMRDFNQPTSAPKSTTSASVTAPST